ncbi:hypothetical protein YC2023_031550 [Brassica napus]
MTGIRTLLSSPYWAFALKLITTKLQTTKLQTTKLQQLYGLPNENEAVYGAFKTSQWHRVIQDTGHMIKIMQVALTHIS